MATTATVLNQGYADDRVASTVSLIQSDDRIVVVDPGMVSHRGLILDPLRASGIEPADVTDVILSHHHPDHTVNIALFANASVHDFMATYRDDVWTDHAEGDFELTASVRLVCTPGHSDEDISTVVSTDAGLIVLTHLWWSDTGPRVDPFSRDQAMLETARAKVLAMAPALIIPGHGSAFAASALAYAD